MNLGFRFLTGPATDVPAPRARSSGGLSLSQGPRGVKARSPPPCSRATSAQAPANSLRSLGSRGLGVAAATRTAGQWPVAFATDTKDTCMASWLCGRVFPGGTLPPLLAALSLSREVYWQATGPAGVCFCVVVIPDLWRAAGVRPTRSLCSVRPPPRGCSSRAISSVL